MAERENSRVGTELRELIRHHMDAPGAAEVDWIEGMGALNFLALDDIPAADEGEPLESDSILALPSKVGSDRALALPELPGGVDDPFVQDVNASGHKWVVLTDTTGEPQLALDVDGLLRDVLVHGSAAVVAHHCHRPIIVRDPALPLGRIIVRLRAPGRRKEDDVIDDDVVLIWGANRRIITGADILGRLLRGIARDSARSVDELQR